MSVAHLGRRPDAFQTTALQWRQPECVTRGCRDAARLQADPDDPWTDTHYTWLPGLQLACGSCHDKKTHQGWAWTGDLDADGKRCFVGPDDPRHPDRTGQRPPVPPRVEAKSDRGPRPIPADARPTPTLRRAGRSAHSSPGEPGDDGDQLTLIA